MIILKPKKILKILFTIIFILLCCHIIGFAHKTVIGGGFITYTFEPLFNLDSEATVPSYISSILFLVAAAILALIAINVNTKKFQKHWWLLSVVFIYLSFDEFCEIHEMLTMPVRSRIDLDVCLFHVAAFIPIVVVLTIFSLLFVKFILSLPSSVKINFGISAFIFLLGALGMEILGAFYIGTYSYQIIMPIEEVLEMIGVSLFIYSLLNYKERWENAIIIKINTNN